MERDEGVGMIYEEFSKCSVSTCQKTDVGHVVPLHYSNNLALTLFGNEPDFIQYIGKFKLKLLTSC